MNWKAIRNGGEVLEILTESFVGGIVSIPYQASFGLSLRFYDGVPMYRFYLGRLKVWLSVRKPNDLIQKGKINSRVDW